MTRHKYGIVVDSGSSGSRIQIYSWPDPSEVSKEDTSQWNSVPRVFQQEDWSYKTSPGVSTFADKPHKVWDDHYEDLIEYAEKIIPKEQWNETPIFILATAGMRLVPKKKRDTLLETICEKVGKKSGFLLENCAEQVQIIDGETEGLYGWISLNYLLGQMDDYDVSSEESNESLRPSYGFMDMGGASTQISFVPYSREEIVKHRDDISTVYLRNVGGGVQQWDVFVSTWLGFGANEARKRYLKNLINILPELNNSDDEDDFNTKAVNDPCLPRGAKLDFLHLKHSYEIIGSGDYESCLKTTYPLLLKNLPCTETPCLFNGVHAPEIDFQRDKFVGISEYWYTANDVFHMGGEYNFLQFNEKVKSFCESEWSEIQKNSEQGAYNNVPTSILIDACFKANWVINVLHEGFNLPRVGIEEKHSTSEDVDLEYKPHIPFQSAGSIRGAELSWTLGRILLYASSMIASSDKISVGIAPASKESKPFVYGGIDNPSLSSQLGHGSWSFLLLFVFLGALTLAYLYMYKRDSLKRFPTIFTQITSKLKAKYNHYRYLKLSTQEQTDLESGTLATMDNHEDKAQDGAVSGSMSPALKSNEDFKSLRTRSYANFHLNNAFAPKKNSSKSPGSFLEFSEFNREGLVRSQSSTVL